jgi:hypothetical protein
MQQHRVVGGPLDQGADGGQVLAADDEISFLTLLRGVSLRLS